MLPCTTMQSGASPPRPIQLADQPSPYLCPPGWHPSPSVAGMLGISAVTSGMQRSLVRRTPASLHQHSICMWRRSYLPGPSPPPAHTHQHTPTYTYTRTNTHTHAPTHIHIHRHQHTYTCANTQSHINTHQHTHTPTHLCLCHLSLCDIDRAYERR